MGRSTNPQPETCHPGVRRIRIRSRSRRVPHPSFFCLGGGLLWLSALTVVSTRRAVNQIVPHNVLYIRLFKPAAAAVLPQARLSRSLNMLIFLDPQLRCKETVNASAQGTSDEHRNPRSGPGGQTTKTAPGDRRKQRRGSVAPLA